MLRCDKRDETENTFPECTITGTDSCCFGCEHLAQCKEKHCECEVLREGATSCTFTNDDGLTDEEPDEVTKCLYAMYKLLDKIENMTKAELEHYFLHFPRVGGQDQYAGMSPFRREYNATIVNKFESAIRYAVKEITE